MGFDRVFIQPEKKIKKIALEEHFLTQALAPYSANSEQGVAPEPMEDFKKRLADFDGLRLEEMDKAGVDISVLSATTPGVQVEPNATVAVRKAREHPNFAKIKFVVGASCSLIPGSVLESHHYKKINLHIWDAPKGERSK
jgi:hypothetical protein